MAITTQLSALGLLVAVLIVVSAAAHAGHRAGRTRRGLTWADWSGRDQVPVHARQVGSSDEEYYRNGIHFELYTAKNPDEPELLDIYSSELDFETVFDARRPTKVAVHGWLSDGLGLIQLRKAFLATSEVNFIAVNWTDIDTIVYPLARYHVSSIAQRVAFLLDFLRIMFGVPLSSVHVIGHSLGAHISGLAGSMVQWGRLGRITGLDPAGPLFLNDPTRRLDKNDAMFVDVIHTCANLLGYRDAIGHTDFYPNGGNCFQPGCALTDMTQGTCSHDRGYDFMEESIRGGIFTAFPCAGANSAPDFSQPDKNIVMGVSTPPSSRGSFCLYTNDASPFAMDQTKQLKVAANTSTTEPDEQFRGRVYRTFMRRGTEYESLGRDMPDY